MQVAEQAGDVAWGLGERVAAGWVATGLALARAENAFALSAAPH